MMSRTFAFKAIQPDGRTRKGRIVAADETDAYARLRAESLSPVSLKETAAMVPTEGRRAGRLREADIEAFLSGLAVLLRAGADIRTALTVLGEDHAAIRAVAQRVVSGMSVEAASAPLFGPGDAHLAALIAAGEMRGDLPAGLDAAAHLITTRRRIRDQLIEALSYPAFVLVTAVAALLVILLVVIPAIAPLLTDTQHELPLYFRIVVWLSDGLQVGWPFLLGGLLAGALAILAGYRYGGLKRHVEGWMLDGPFASMTRPVVFGTYARTLGEMLTRGAGLTEGLRLCQRTVINQIARERLDVVVASVRQGRQLSESLRQVKGFPKPVIKLCEIGEASGALGAMLARAGEREEVAALARIAKVSKLLGPLLIMVLGGVVGLIMGGVLTALTDIGGVAGS